MTFFSALQVLLLLSLFGLSGLAWFAPKQIRADQALTLFLTCALMLPALCVLLLADLGLFSGATLWGLLLILLCSSIPRLRHLRPQGTLFPAGALTLAVALAAGMLLHKPHTYLSGGLDPGEYIATSAHMVRTGGIRYQEPFLQELPEILYPTFLRNPVEPRRTLQAGYVILDDARGEMVPDYFHLYPSWLAIFTLFGGLPAAYAGQTVLAVLALGLVTLFTANLIKSAWAALAVAAVLLANPAILYFGRFPSSEFLSMGLLFGLLSWFSLARRPAPAALVAIGLTAFAATVCHITNLLPLTAIGIVLLLVAYAHRERQRLLMPAALALGTLAGLARNAWVTPVFLRHLFYRYLVARPDFVTLLLLGFLVLAGLGTWVWRQGASTRPGTLQLRIPSILRDKAHWVPAMLILAAGLYQYVLRPRGAETHNAYNLRHLALLFSPAGIALVFTSFFQRFWRSASLDRLLFLAAGLFSSAVLIHRKHIQPFHMWAFRRYIPVVIPFFAILLVLTLFVLSRKRPHPLFRAMALLMLAGLLTWQGRRARFFVRTHEHAGLPEFVQQLAHDMADADFLLVDHWRLATPLRYAFGLPAFQLSRETDPVNPDQQSALMALLADKVARYDHVYYLSHRGPFAYPGIQPVLIAEHRLETTEMAWTQHGLPNQIRSAGATANLFRLQAAPAPLPPEGLRWDIGYHSIGLMRGFHGNARSGDITYRWTNGDAVLYLPALPEGGRLTLHLAHMRPEIETLPVEITLDGHTAAAWDIIGGWADYELSLPPNPEATQLGIRSNTWDPADHGHGGYPPDLGIRVESLTVRPAQSSGTH